MSNHYNPNLPQYEWGSAWRSKAISEKQFTMIERLAADLNIAIISDLNTLLRGTASMVIDQLSDAKRNGGAQGQWRHHNYDEIRHRTSKFQFEVKS
jgi:hypothetical protein